MSQISNILKFFRTLVIGGFLGASGIIALLLFGPQWFRGAFISKQPQPIPSNVAANTSVNTTPAAGLASTPQSTPLNSSSPTPVESAQIKQVAFEDIKGVFGEKEITELAKLGVFDSTSGKFSPQSNITRGDFMRLLVRANNAIWVEQDKQIREAEGGQATFADVPPTHPNFRYIQGLLNTGFVSGFDEKTFAPDQPLTREQMVAIKIAVDRGGVYDFTKFNGQEAKLNTEFAVNVPRWTDREQISKKFIRAFNTEYRSFSNTYKETFEGNTFKNIERTFGATATFKPQQPVTRAEAAVCISLIGEHIQDGEKFRTAQQALENKAKNK
ncbi:MAG: S-layer homology domain-containing protein [Scytonematopsis contorta HA4267-MV1]|jgi:hypothetical protein|nr:S-layer homology domain-containing protein [Scytonematopsis contorta HA4267-MV1]